MLSGKVMIINLITGFIKKIFLCKMSIFQNHIFIAKTKIKVVLYLSDYGRKSDVKSGIGIVTLKFAKMADLANSKSDIRY